MNQRSPNMERNNQQQQQQQKPLLSLPHSLHPLTLTATIEEGPTTSLPAAVDTADDDAVIAAPLISSMLTTHENNAASPAEIPPEENPKPSSGNGGDDGDGEITNDCQDEDDDDDEDADDWGEEDSYEYEDEDDGAFSGFLAPAVAARSVPISRSASVEPLEDEDDVQNNDNDDTDNNSKRKWKEPTRAAVNMSLRAQSESTGGKRRLAQDLYRIMNQDTEDAGFSLHPKCEDSMNSWVIKLFQFDDDSNLAKDMKVVGVEHIELEMKFPDQYPFEPPFVRVVRPRFKRQTGFVMNGALCMELLTKDGWNPINDIESVIVSIRSLLVVGDGRLHAAAELDKVRYNALLKAETADAAAATEDETDELAAAASDTEAKTGDDHVAKEVSKRARVQETASAKPKPVSKEQVGSYTASEAQSAYSHLSDFHKKKGWDTSGWWSRKG